MRWGAGLAGLATYTGLPTNEESTQKLSASGGALSHARAPKEGIDPYSFSIKDSHIAGLAGLDPG